MSGGSWRAAQHHLLVDQYITAMIDRDVDAKVLLIAEPPRHGKSEHVSHWLPAWFPLVHPEDYIGVASYGAGFANEWGRLARMSWMEAAPLLNYRIDPRRNAVSHWGPAGYRGGMRTGGIRSGWSGKGVRVFVLDDLIKDDRQAMSELYLEEVWAWFRSTARSRLTPNGIIVVMATRWTQKDITGRVLDGGLGKGWPFIEVSLPALAEHDDPLGRQPGEALWPEQWPADLLATYREGDGTRDYWWQALYQQRPTQHQFAAFPDEYFEGVYAEDWPPYFELSVLAVDPSKGEEEGDYSAIVFAGLYDGCVYIDADLGRYPAPELVERAAEWGREVLPDELSVESNGFQELLVADIEDYATRHGLLPFEVHRILNYNVNKRVRIRRLGAPLRYRQLRFRKGSRSVELLLSQLKSFPMGDYDDGPDALEMAWRRLHELARERMEA